MEIVDYRQDVVCELNSEPWVGDRLAASPRPKAWPKAVHFAIGLTLVAVQSVSVRSGEVLASSVGEVVGQQGGVDRLTSDELRSALLSRFGSEKSLDAFLSSAVRGLRATGDVSVEQADAENTARRLLDDDGVE
jgi:hypothetical protein